MFTHYFVVFTQIVITIDYHNYYHHHHFLLCLLSSSTILRQHCTNNSYCSIVRDFRGRSRIFIWGGGGGGRMCRARTSWARSPMSLIYGPLYRALEALGILLLFCYQGSFKGPGSSLWFYAVSCYLSLTFKYSHTKWDLKHSRSNY